MNKRDFWQHHIQAWKESGLSKSAYCRQHELALHNFQYWTKRLLSNPKPKLIPVVAPTRSNAVATLRIGHQVIIETSPQALVDILASLNERGLLNVAP